MRGSAQNVNRENAATDAFQLRARPTERYIARSAVIVFAAYNSARESKSAMNPSFEKSLADVWRQVLVENATVVELDGNRYPVRITPRKGLRQVDFVYDGNEIRGLEQNPDTKSRWAQLARAGKKVMQFLSEGRYVANVVDGKVILYGR